MYSGKPWSAAGAAAADQEHPVAPAVRGRHPFTPPSRTRAFRGGANGDKLVYTAVVKGESNGVHHDDAVIRYGGITLSGAERFTGGGGSGGDPGQWQEYWRDKPEDDDPDQGTPIRAVARLGLILGVGLLAAGLIWAVMNAREHPATLTKAAAQTSVLLEQPSRWVAEVTTGTRGTTDTTGTTAGGSKESTAGSALKAVPRTSALPRPEPPAARLSPASVSLGQGRTGSFALSCTGRCEVVSASGTDGIAVSGNRFRIKETARSGRCDDEPVVRRGEIAVRWAGRTSGDGHHTGGTTAGGGTLRLKVSWTVERGDGVLTLDARDGTHWRDC
ncbi:hypothetical protein AB0M50_49465 [Nonomuraea fuscirosea]|uniref:hypothetical protein n=1 Tax=Nonomuraea fuscirosea TaxID=1291556 RepID=UPI003422FAB7